MVVKKNFFLCFILPPIGAFYIVMNRGALQKRDFILYLLFAAINISLWLSLMIFDRTIWMVVGNRKCGLFVLRIQIDRREAL
ncbi:hypothetical protein F8161_25805 [Bacillus cereus]|uniref:Uncharacterized protein n=2 Tax=Bacillus cereus group TaxID=86661 RepID=A0A9X6SIZ8_BACTU|nr:MULTISPECIES: hypothetical protein [Bacillus cereus group]OUB30353.1 hypothetical protein BK737_18510 [Bacillus thuringiensis serovar palmanyolensis]AQY37719.1 hypothetical protein B4918_06745 [Bacillus thuringiensis]KAA6458142.1 hypothetical protein DX932_22190 [Bacillus cereus]KAA6468125.1 hypothetical protein DX930_02825 [Bacillus cereus]KAA6480243.1 hypothetical protein DX931_18410 [Bacillus cereus]